MASHIDWSLDSPILRRKLLILSTKKLKQLCKSLNVQYSTDKLDTILRLINTKKASIINESKTDTNVDIETKETDTSNTTHTEQTDDSKENKPKVVLKVGMLGDHQIGIRTLMVKYIEDKYDEDYIETLGVNFMEKTIHLKRVDVTISIWVCRNSSWYTHGPLVCSDAKVIIFAFDLTAKQTLFSVKRYYKESRKENKYFMPFLVGTKYDLFAERDAEYKADITRQARKFASKMHSPLIYCSSLMSINIKKIFKLIVAKCFDLNPKMKEVNNINEPLFEWSTDRIKKENICIVYGYIRESQKEFKWQYTMPIYDFANIILLFYANIVIGGNNKEYKVESRTHKKMQRKIRRMERKKVTEKKLKNTYTIEIETENIETENKENVS